MSVPGWFDIAGSDAGWFDESAYAGGWFDRLVGADEAIGSVGAPAPLPHLGLMLGPVTDFSVAADVGAFALTGQSATLRAGWKLVAADGSYALSGQDATLAYVVGSGGSVEFPAPLPHLGLILGAVTGYTGVSDTGSFLLNGHSAGLYRRYTHVCAVGSYAWTGVAATLTKGAFNSTQYPAPLPHLSSLLSGATGAYSLPALAGSFTLSGQAATLRRGIGLIAVPGAYLWTGAPALRDMQLTASAGAFVQTWVDPVITATHNPLTSAAGSYVVSGYAAGLSYAGANKSLAGFTGTFDVAGQDAVFEHGLAIIANAGAFTFAGQDAGYQTTGAFEQPDEEGWRGAGGTSKGRRRHYGTRDETPWWMSIPTKPLPAKVERAIESSVRAPEAQARAVLVAKIDRAGVKWKPEYADVLAAMQERDIASIAALRKQIEQEVIAARQRDDDDLAVAILLAA